MTPSTDLAGARDAARRLLAHLDELPVEALRAPSLLPGWTRAHVVAHPAGNARSHVRLLEACLAGEVREQYEGGSAAREAGIEALAADPRRGARRAPGRLPELERCWAAMTPEHWSREVHWLDAPAPSPAGEEPRSRWREVEVHGVDLATDHRWPPACVRGAAARRARRPSGPARPRPRADRRPVPRHARAGGDRTGRRAGRVARGPLRRRRPHRPLPRRRARAAPGLALTDPR